MTKLNKKFGSIDELCCREFETDETLALLVATNPQIYASWGVENKLNYLNKALFMKVNGHHHKGWLVITLAFSDTYSFYLLEGRATYIYAQHEIYFDQLQEQIDIAIERIDDYKF